MHTLLGMKKFKRQSQIKQILVSLIPPPPPFEVVGRGSEAQLHVYLKSIPARKNSHKYLSRVRYS